MPQPVKRSLWQRLLWGGLVLAVTAALLLRTQLVRDVWSGLTYQPTAAVVEIRDDLALSGYGKRVFAATQPALETSETFNTHCAQLGAETNVLGCYITNDDRIYVYAVTREELKVSNKSTMAHELLHAVWERLSETERQELAELLEQVYAENEELLGEVLGYYEATDRQTELFARLGTEIGELPAELERYYARVFTDRQRIVQYYQQYAEPLAELREKIEQLKLTILSTKYEITAERDEYERQLKDLDQRIQRFNSCANQAGCFTTMTFNAERRQLERRQTELNEQRDQLNAKILANNARIEQFNAYQAELGALSDAMDSTAVVGE